MVKSKELWRRFWVHFGGGNGKHETPGVNVSDINYKAFDKPRKQSTQRFRLADFKSATR